MPYYRDDMWPLPPPSGDEPVGPPTPWPDDESPEPEDPGVPDFPEGMGAGGDFDDLDDPDPDVEDDYGGPDDYGGREDDEYLMNPTVDRCLRARHELGQGLDRIEDLEHSLDAEQERLEEARRDLVVCAAGRIRIFTRDARGRLVEVDCREYLMESIQRSEQRIEKRTRQLADARARLPELQRRAEEACAGR